MRKLILHILYIVVAFCPAISVAQDSIAVEKPDVQIDHIKDDDQEDEIDEYQDVETAADSLMMSVGLTQGFSWGEHAPFWLVNNRQGLSSIRKGSGYLMAALEKPVDTSGRLSWGAGAELAVAWDYTSDIVVQKLYGELHYKSLGLVAGSTDQSSALCDPWLSSGGLLYSGNSRPIPQVRAGIFEYEPLKFTHRWISVKGYLSYGLFTDSSWQRHWVGKGDKYMEHVMLCSRGLWIKVGDESRRPFTCGIGIEMGTQFGGTIYNYRTAKEVVTLKMPTGPKAWLKAFIPLPGDKTTILGEQTNVEGNTVGTYDLELKWKSKDGWSLRAYAQHMFEDHSMMWIQFPWKDGMLGFQADLKSNPWLSSVVYEYLYSKFQSGPVYNDTSPEVPEQVSGVDRYYNHYMYTGWMHWGMGIGNPLSVSPIYNADHVLEFYATRNISHHLGLCGTPHPDLDWRMLVSYTRSWGDYWKPFPEVKSMLNFMAEVSWYPEFMPGFEWKAAVGFDTGDLVGKNFGFMVGLRFDLWTPMSQLRNGY